MPTGVYQRKLRPIQDRFWEKVTKSDGCWLWIACKSYSYGKINIDGKRVLAHRVSWELANGHIPEGMLVLHHCDVPACVRPDHLYLGSKSDNMNDAYRRGQAIPFKLKLTEKQVSEIRAIGRSESQHQIASDYSISQPMVSRILSGESWRPQIELPI